VNAHDRSSWAALHRELLDTIARDGLDTPAPGYYVWRGLYVTAAYALSFIGLLSATTWLERLLFAGAAGFASLQAGFIGHDVSHKNLTAHPWRLRLWGQYFTTLLAGNVYAYWERQHLAHHRHTQEFEKDPDVDVGLFAMSPQSARAKRGFNRWTTRHQAVLLWPALLFQVLAIRVSALAYALKRWRRCTVDLTTASLHYALWLAVPALLIGPAAAAVNFGLYCALYSLYVFSSFLWNHVGTESFEHEPRRAYAAQRFLGCRNLPGGPLHTLAFGGLNFHTEHHLAPHVPTARLASVRPLLQRVLAKHGLKLEIVSFTQAMRDVHRYVAEVALLAAEPANQVLHVEVRQRDVAHAQRSA
jgi:fatty acid desaturase